MLLHNQYEFDPNTNLIGSGGFARVYKAFDINLQRYVALKRFDKKDTKYSVLNEIRRCFDFNHPNIIRYINCFQVENRNDFGETEVVEFGVMEYADAGDFSQLIDKKTKVSSEEFQAIVTGILDGLQYLHAPNPMHQKPAIIHRDLKASNILFTRIDGKLIPKICDFGISKEMGGSGTTTVTGTGYLGTIEYMSPEQINLTKFGVNGKLLPNTDLWALGCMLYEYFTGKAPFGKRTDGDLPIDIQSNILDKEPDYPATIPTPYKELIQNCLIKEASKRIADVNALKGIIRGELEIKKPEEPVIEKDDSSNYKWISKLWIVFNLVTISVFVFIFIYLIWKEISITSDITNDSSREYADTSLVSNIADSIAAAPMQFTNHRFSYQGEIKEGTAKVLYYNGDKYTGGFENGLKSGYGTYYWKDGERFEGQFQNNKRNGFGKYYDANGNIIEQGNYVDGELQQ